MDLPTRSLTRYILLSAMVLLTGCTPTVPGVREAAVSPPTEEPAAVPEVRRHPGEFDPPTRERPIVTTVGVPDDMLLFGGPDGRRRILIKRPPGFVTYGICYYGRSAAILTNDGRVGFYDASGNIVGSMPLPGFMPLRADETMSGSVYVGPRRRAVVTVVRSPAPTLVAPAAVRPWSPPPPTCNTTYYVDMDERAVRLEVDLTYSVWFTADGGFVVVARRNAVAESRANDTYRVLRFNQPEQPSWEVEFEGRPWPYVGQPGWDFSLRLPGRWPIHFRADGTYAILRDDPADFNRLNSGYVQRAGKSYENEYLDKAVDDLAKTIGLDRRQRDDARNALRAFLYDWLEAYAREGGYMMPADHSTCIAALDRWMEEILTGEQFPAYRVWRQEAVNTLGFLIRPPLDPSVHPQIRVRHF